MISSRAILASHLETVDSREIVHAIQVDSTKFSTFFALLCLLESSGH
jgi:hypothetical protein